MKNELVYLAAPYSHPDPTVVESRIETVYRYDAYLSSQGIYTVSPLLKHHTLKYQDLPSDWNYWGEYSFQLLSRCDRMIVMKLVGWEESTGVQQEIDYCIEHGIPIEYV